MLTNPGNSLCFQGFSLCALRTTPSLENKQNHGNVDKVGASGGVLCESNNKSAVLLVDEHTQYALSEFIMTLI